MDRKLWQKDYFMEDYVPAWMCPVCNQGHLILDSKSFKFNDTGQSLKDRRNPEWDREWESYRVIAFFNCQFCQEKIAVIGIGTNNYCGGTDANNNYKEWYEKRYFPSYFIPSLNIIKCPIDNLAEDKAKTKILLELEKSFSLFWCDYDACANKLRNVVERILDQQRVRKVHKPEGKKESPIRLQNRIELYKKRAVEAKNKIIEDVADHLLAIKFIGNPASHAQSISRTGVLDAFELIEHCLKKLFDDEDERISTLSKKIRRKRAPIR